ncbi:unnamed protein product [Allacma fusca]|uniref:Helicase ATP-binding domain-containing protein n=1 Tax=Allacma fusca TaxID=39272 RepID=A0A8J2KY62_9HEXA|nr:unnamed protein product [Allacma fusca]
MHVDGGIPAAGIVPRIYTFHGVQVKFPLEAYQSQLQMMNKILYHTIRGQNLLTESVAGTGKTLALLCSLLAYQKNHATLRGNMKENTQPQANPPLIFYATKTLAHIKHIIGQLALTQYVNTPMGILSSVKNTCNNEESDEHLCDYIPEDLAWLDHLNGQSIQAWDLEDLKKFCRENETCAYHELKSTINNAKIIFCTYNYLLHSGIRQAMNINLKGNILVFDEGHNVEDLCRDIASTPKLFFTLTKITQMTEILQRALASPQLQDGVRNHVRNLATTFQGFRDYLKNQLAAVITSGRSHVNVSFDDLVRDLTLVGLGPNHLQQLRTDVSNLNGNVLGLTLQGQFPEFRTKVQVMRYLSNALILLSTLWDGYPNEFLNSNSYVVLLCQPALDEPDEEDDDGNK